jgi:hypothetical protein
MPGYDGTGPRGQGPGSGWGMGPCGAGQRRGFGRSMGRGSWGGGAWGVGRGAWGRPRWGWGARGGYGPFGPGGGPISGTPQDEIQALKEEAASLQGELEAVQRRIAELGSA